MNGTMPDMARIRPTFSVLLGDPVREDTILPYSGWVHRQIAYLKYLLSARTFSLCGRLSLGGGRVGASKSDIKYNKIFDLPLLTIVEAYKIVRTGVKSC